ncbi:MAG: hypothetical protein ACLQDV_25645 [Candidatus Binataceae bacterium]
MTRKIIIRAIAAVLSGCSAQDFAWHHLAGYDRCDGLPPGQQD